MKKHKFGPWTVGKPFKSIRVENTVTPIEYKAEPCGSCGVSSGTWLVAWLFKNALPKGMVKPIAHLIAAAPDLYSALCDGEPSVRDKIAEEIRSGGGIFSDAELAAIDAAIAKAEGPGERGGPHA